MALLQLLPRDDMLSQNVFARPDGLTHLRERSQLKALSKMREGGWRLVVLRNLCGIVQTHVGN